jgi:hypothetical protein
VVKVEGVTWVTDKYEIIEATDRSCRYPYMVLGNFIPESKLHDAAISARSLSYSLEFLADIQVRPVAPSSTLIARYNNARVYHELYSVTDKLKGLAETFVNEHLSPEMKELLKRAPAAAETASDLLYKGIAAAIESLKK